MSLRGGLPYTACPDGSAVMAGGRWVIDEWVSEQNPKALKGLIGELCRLRSQTCPSVRELYEELLSKLDDAYHEVRDKARQGGTVDEREDPS